MDAHTIFYPIRFNSPGRSIVPYLPHFHVWVGWARRHNKSAVCTIAWWGLRWDTVCHRTVSMKPETTKSILKHHDRWEPQNFNIGFFVIESWQFSESTERKKQQRNSLQSDYWRKHYGGLRWHMLVHECRHIQSPTLSRTLIISSFGGP